MKLDEKRISQIQTVLTDDDDFVEFAEEDFDEGLWYVSKDCIHRFGAKDESGEQYIEKTYSNRIGDRPYREFYEQIKGKELKARIFLGYHMGKPQYKVFTEWEDLAKAIGVSELVTLATKVPKVIAKRFTVFANMEGGRSNVLRNLVYEYVKKKMIENIDSLMFKEEI